MVGISVETFAGLLVLLVVPVKLGVVALVAGVRVLLTFSVGLDVVPIPAEIVVGILVGRGLRVGLTIVVAAPSLVVVGALVFLTRSVVTSVTALGRLVV